MTMRSISISAVIAFVATGLFLTVISAGVLTRSQTVSSTGTISSVGVGVYNDGYCTSNCTNISWGNLAPGGMITKTVYIKNTGNTAVTLTIATSSWNPSSASSYLTLAWNRAGYTLAAGASIDATLTLSASSGAGAISSFSFNIVITGTSTG